VTLDGRAVAWDITALPDAVDFGELAAGSTSNPQTITVSNTGTEAVLVELSTLEGLQPSAFALDVDGCSGVRLFAVGESCDIAASFRPTGEGPFSATLRIASTATGGADFVSLQGVATPPGLIFRDDFELGDLSRWSLVFPNRALVVPITDGNAAASVPEPLDFGPQAPGGSSDPAEVTVVNAGTDFIDIDPVALNRDPQGEFSIAEDRCSGARLEAGEACKISIVFSPAQLGESSAELIIPSTAGAGPAVVPVVGLGLEPEGKR
jgi:hypothetical protein